MIASPWERRGPTLAARGRKAISVSSIGDSASGSRYPNEPIEPRRLAVEGRRRLAAACAVYMADERVREIRPPCLEVFETCPHFAVVLHDPVIACEQAFHGSG